MFGQNLAVGRPAADALGAPGRADAGVFCRSKGGLHDPILQGVEGEDHDPAAGGQEVDAAVHRLPKALKLAVDLDADSLEAAAGRVLLFLEAELGRDGPGDEVRELRGGLDGL